VKVQKRKKENAGDELKERGTAKDREGPKDPGGGKIRKGAGIIFMMRGPDPRSWEVEKKR